MYAGRDGDRMVGWMREKAARQHIADLEQMGWDLEGSTVEEYEQVTGMAPVLAQTEGE
jgi:hypothetical protein